MLVNLETALMTPPFGLLLFVMKGVAPRSTFAQIYMAAAPYVIMNIVVMGVLMLFPELVQGALRMVSIR